VAFQRQPVKSSPSGGRCQEVVGDYVGIQAIFVNRRRLDRTPLKCCQYPAKATELKGEERLLLPSHFERAYFSGNPSSQALRAAACVLSKAGKGAGI